MRNNTFSLSFTLYLCIRNVERRVKYKHLCQGISIFSQTLVFFFFTFYLYCTQHHTDIGPIVLACLKYMKVKSKVDETFTKSDR